jgi:hypothetical protein
MVTWTIPNAGEIRFEMDENLGQDTKIIKDLLKQIINRMAKHSYEYYKLTYGTDQIFLNSEKELCATISPAIAEVTPVFKTEFKCKTSKKNHSGLVDYIVFLKNRPIVIETKFNHKSFRTKWVDTDNVFTKFNEMLNDLDRLINEEILFFLDENTQIITIAFEIIVFNTSQKIRLNNPSKLKEYRNETIHLFNQLRNHDQFNKNINFNSLWLLDEKLIFLKPGRKQKAKYNMAVGFIGHIEFK